jgi:hypothetical protein
MDHRTPFGRACRSFGAALVLTTLFVTVAFAHQEGEEDEGPNTGRFSITLNNDFTNAYFFRGVLNERDGFIWQPSIELSMNVYSGEGLLTGVDLGFGIWNSVHTEETLADGAGPEALYETDYYPSITFTWAETLQTSVIYYWYTSPNGAFNTVEQIDLELSYDDSGLLGPFAFYPTATFSFELENTSFGDEEGGYFEFIGSPGFEVALSDDYPLAVSFPCVIGVSMYDYFEDDSGDDELGYGSLGLDAGLPLAFIPPDYGAWSVTLGLDIYLFNDNLEEANEGDEIYDVWTGSITMEY